MTDQAQVGPEQQGTAVALRPRTPTEEWLARQTGVEILDTADGRVISLPPALGERVNLLTPTTQIVQVSPNFSPIPRIVQLDVAEHAYEEKNAGRGRFALNAKGLDLIADAAGIDWEPPVIDYMGGAGVSYTAVGTKRGPDGVARPYTATKAVRFAVLERKARRERRAQIERWDNPPTGPALEDMLDKYVDEVLERIDAVTETKAKNRVVRHWQAVKSTYTKAELAKPFLVIQWALTPDRDDPNVAQIIDLQFAKSSRSLYGTPRPARTALAPTPEVRDEQPLDTLPPGDRPDGVDEHGQVIEAHDESPGEPEPSDRAEPVDAEVVAPPRPADATKLTGGPFKGMTVDAVVEDEEGRAWLLGSVGRIRNAATRRHLLAWLSFAEGRPLDVEECGRLAREDQEPPR